MTKRINYNFDVKSLNYGKCEEIVNEVNNFPVKMCSGWLTQNFYFTYNGKYSIKLLFRDNLIEFSDENKKFKL